MSLGETLKRVHSGERHWAVLSCGAVLGGLKLSLDENQRCDQSSEKLQVVLSCVAVYYVVQYDSKF